MHEVLETSGIVIAGLVWCLALYAALTGNWYGFLADVFGCTVLVIVTFVYDGAE